MAPIFRAIPPYAGNAPFTGRAADLAILDDWGLSTDPVMVVQAIGGTGKSALTWNWTHNRAAEMISGLAGRLWWSFYESSASITSLLQELLRYITDWPDEEIDQLSQAELADEVFNGLHRSSYLVVLDGFERLLVAYDEFGSTRLQNEEAESGNRLLIDGNSTDIVRRLSEAAPSKILISTRLMPQGLEARFGPLLPGVRHLRLPGLTDSDTVTLLGRLGVRGSEQAITRFFGSLDNHPLLIGIVAGLVRDYRTAPCDFDRWLTDPTAGGALNVPDIDLTQRRTHILSVALNGLEPGPQQLLGWISVLAASGAVPWATLEAANPFRSTPSTSGVSTVDPSGSLSLPVTESSGSYGRGVQGQHDVREHQSLETQLRVNAQLDAALRELEDRGLVQWNRFANSYDLHPIIRAYAFDQFENADRILAYDRIRDHFQDLPATAPEQASGQKEIAQTSTIFRTLIETGQFEQARMLWPRFSAMLVDLGAHETIIRLLGAHEGVTRDSPLMQGDLAMAYGFSRSYDAAIDRYANVLASRIKAEDYPNSIRCLLQLGVYFRESGSNLAASRCLDLGEMISLARGNEVDSGQCLLRAIQAALQGMVDQARQLLNQAEALGPPLNFPWFRDAVEYWRLYLTFAADHSLAPSQLSGAFSRVRSWKFRRELIMLDYKLSIRQGDFEHAVSAAQDYENLSRNADLETAPAASALALAKLGRVGEARVAVEESLTRFPLMHSAQRPYLIIAQAFRELGCQPEAVTFGDYAYRQAWQDGPPYCKYWALGDARALLEAIRQPIPDLPTVDPVTMKIPLEDRIRSFAAKLQAKSGG